MPLKIYSQPTVRYRVAIAAGKGGVGKSTVTVYLALALKRLGFQTGILDADLYGPSIRKMLPEDRLPVHGRPALSAGIQTMTMAYFEGNAFVRAPIANRIITQFLEETKWDNLDFLLIDLPPGTGDIHLTVSQKADLSGAVMVTTSQQIALADVRKGIQMLMQTGVPILGVLENMSYLIDPVSGVRMTPFGEGGGEALAAEFGVPFLGKIPLDPEISQCNDTGKTASLKNPLFDRIAERVSAALLQKEEQQVAKIMQKSSNELLIKWEDGESQVLRAFDLQKGCPCANCIQSNQVLPDVGIERVEKVGRYALRFDFTSGCSYGIYDFALLKRVGQL